MKHGSFIFIALVLLSTLAFVSHLKDLPKDATWKDVAGLTTSNK